MGLLDGIWQREHLYVLGRILLSAGMGAESYLLRSRHWNRARPAEEVNFRLTRRVAYLGQIP